MDSALPRALSYVSPNNYSANSVRALPCIRTHVADRHKCAITMCSPMGRGLVVFPNLEIALRRVPTAAFCFVAGTGYRSKKQPSALPQRRVLERARRRTHWCEPAIRTSMKECLNIAAPKPQCPRGEIFHRRESVGQTRLPYDAPPCGSYERRSFQVVSREARWPRCLTHES